MISLLIGLLILGLVLYLVYYGAGLLLGALGAPPVVLQIVGLVLVLMFVLAMFNGIGGFVAIPLLR